MPRLRNIRTGVIVSVEEDTAARLAGFESADSESVVIDPRRGQKRAGTTKK